MAGETLRAWRWALSKGWAASSNALATGFVFVPRMNLSLSLSFSLLPGSSLSCKPSWCSACLASAWQVLARASSDNKPGVATHLPALPDTSLHAFTHAEVIPEAGSGKCSVTSDWPKVLPEARRGRDGTASSLSFASFVAHSMMRKKSQLELYAVS